MKNNAVILGKNLRNYIEQSGMLDKEVASAVGVSPATLSEWTKGKKYPRIDKIELLANLFHVQKSDLIEEKKEENNSQSEEEFVRRFALLTPDQQRQVLEYEAFLLSTHGSGPSPRK